MNLFFASLALATTLVASDANVQTVPVLPTPESSTVVLKIAIPQPGEVVGRPVWIQFRIYGYPLGTESQFDRASEIATTEMGQTIHVVVDNEPYFPINEPALDPFDEAGDFYDTSYKFQVPFRLSDGSHTIRMFPARSFGESLKGDQAFAAINFYVGSETGTNADLSAPMLTYNEPSPQMYLTEGKPILLDFYLSNVSLSSDGYKVRLTIDGKVNRVLTSWQPFYILGLKKGRHKVRLELLDERNQQVSGPFNDTTRTITVH